MKQHGLSTPCMVAFIAYMQMFVPLSIDLYLPALPEMASYFSTSPFLVNMTLAGFFLTFALGIILFGPMVDMYGRKKTLLIGAVIYTLSSLGCALSPSIYTLILFRLLQALGAGAIITTSTALIKDHFSGGTMKKILAITQALAVIAPMAAPILGGVLLTFTAWHGAFYTLTILGAVTILGACFLTETLAQKDRFTGNVFSSFRLFSQFLHYGDFLRVLVLFSLLAAPYMAYLSVSSFVYIERFHVSPQAYSFYFAANSAGAVIGPFLYLRLARHVSNHSIARLIFMVSVVSGALLLTVAGMHPVLFLLAFLPYTIAESIVRPFTVDVLLSRIEKDTGTASSLINFVPTLFGSLGMAAGSLPWGDLIWGLGILLFVSVCIAMLLYRRVTEL